MLKVAEITVNRQVCLLIDLAISRLDRDQRHAKLDKFLTDYFLEKNLTAKIIHQPGKKAELLLQDIAKENTPLNWQRYDLHISYSLPVVAINWSAKNRENSVGIDLAQEADFVMENEEWQSLQRLYFSPQLPFFQTASTRCQAWSTLEAQHKCCEIALQEYSPERDFLFSNLSVESQNFKFKGQDYWLSVCMINCPG